MKKTILAVATILLVVAVLTVGCAPKAPPAAPPAAPPEVTTAQGTLGEVDVSKSTVTVETPQGPKAFKITPRTALTLEGQACSLDQLAELETSGEPYTCTVVYDEEGEVVALNVYRIAPPASVKGTISDVNIAESTITVKTAAGDKVYEIDPETGLMIGGVACSLELVNALVEALEEAGGELPCTVIYSTDEKGTALYIDIANPPDLVQGTGTLTAVSVEKSTVTIMTDKGERTFEVDAETGRFLNNEVCSLQDYDAALDESGLAGCQVLYYTDKDGNLVYIDVTQTVAP